MIKNVLRKVISRKMISRIKVGTDFLYYYKYLKEIENERGDFDYLIGTPIHANLGDHLITVAEKYYLRRINYNKKVFDIPTEMFLIFSKRLLHKARKTTYIFINGGGWMGNLWPVEEKNMQFIVKIFCHMKIIIFPQTIYYDNRIEGFQTLLDDSIKIYNSCSNLTICLRDLDSYELAKKYYPNARLIYCPDIVLSLTGFEGKRSELNASDHLLGICFRNDREESIDQKTKNRLKHFFTEKGWRITEVSTIADKPIPLYQRNESIKNKLNQFEQCNLIITDRLHGMLFSYITGTKCIVFDNKTKKISGTYNAWLKESQTIRFIRNEWREKDIEQFVNTEFAENEVKDFMEYFSELTEVILHGGN